MAVPGRPARDLPARGHEVRAGPVQRVQHALDAARCGRGGEALPPSTQRSRRLLTTLPCRPPASFHAGCWRPQTSRPLACRFVD